MPRVLDSGNIRIGKQIVLPFRKAVEISFKSLKIRFWRSMVTVSGIVLAIAFLMSILASDAILEALKGTRDPELQALLREKGIEPKLASRRPIHLRSDSQATSDQDATISHKTSPSGAKVWLVALSLLVAVIGIVNAMLMAVTERFREIGTMKCLGALDSFIVKLFLLESSFQGAAGTLIGIALGLILSLVSSSATFGAKAVLTHLPLLELALYSAAAFGTGVVLSVIGAIYPALVAARMEPVAAMRQDF